MKGVKVEGPCQPYNNDVCLLPNKLDEKVPKLQFPTLKFRSSGS